MRRIATVCGVSLVLACATASGAPLSGPSGGGSELNQASATRQAAGRLRENPNLARLGDEQAGAERASAQRTRTPRVAHVILLGEQAIESTVDHNLSGTAEGFAFRARRSGTAASISVYLGARDRATTLLAGLYSARHGHPESLLTSGLLRSPKRGAWNSLGVASARLRSGTMYWLAVLGKGGAIYFRDRRNRLCPGGKLSKRRLRSLPRLWPGGRKSHACGISAYVSAAATKVLSTNAPAGTTTTSSGTTATTAPAPPAVNRFCNVAAAYTNLTTGPHLCGWPDSTNTGYENAPGYPGSLTPASAGSPTCPTTYQSNHTYSFCEYTDSPTFPSDLTDVTFYGDSFESNAWTNNNVRMSTGDNNIVFNYDTFKPLPSVQASPPITDCTKGYQYGIFSTNAEGYTLEHSDMWGFAEAVDTAGSTQANPQIFEDNWLHDAAPGYPYYNGSTCGFHIDGIGYQEGCGTSNCLPSTESYAVIDDNTMEFLGNGNIIAWQQGSYDHLQATNNLLSGDNQPMAGGRCISTASSVCKPPSHITTTGNTLSTYLQYSPPGGDYPIDNAGGGVTNVTSTWNHNYWAVPPGAAWGTPAYNGYYWVPTTNSSGDPKDCGFVSKTDWPNYTNPPC